MAMIQIDHNIPMPTPSSPEGYPFADMQPGDSFFVPAGSAGCVKLRVYVNAAATRYRKASGHDIKLRSIRVTENGVAGLRVWRVQ
jgi:hypothetical protein